MSFCDFGFNKLCIPHFYFFYSKQQREELQEQLKTANQSLEDLSFEKSEESEKFNEKEEQLVSNGRGNLHKNAVIIRKN